jgi:hypothetical protein
VQSVKAVDDQGASVARRKARVLAAAVGEAFYAVRQKMQRTVALFSIVGIKLVTSAVWKLNLTLFSSSSFSLLPLTLYSQSHIFSFFPSLSLSSSHLTSNSSLSISHFLSGAF